MKKLFIILSLLIGAFAAKAQADTNFVQVSKAQWFLQATKSGPVTTAKRRQPSACVGCMEYNSDSAAYEFSNGSVWRIMGSGGSGGSARIDTIYSVIINVDSVYTIIIRSDTIFSNIIHTDSVYSIVIRTDSIFSTVSHLDTIFNNIFHSDSIYVFTSRLDTIYNNILHTDSVYSVLTRVDSIFSTILHTDSVYSITSHTDTLIVLNNLKIPIRDTGDYANPGQGDVTFQPSDKNYYGYNGTRWLCFTCNAECYRDVVITSAQFSTATICTDASIRGVIYAIFWSDIPAYIYDGESWQPSGSGFEMLPAGFNALDSSYKFHVYTIDTSGACANAVTFSTGGGPTYNFVTPLLLTGTDVSVNNAGGDGVTKGVVTFNPPDFTVLSGVAYINYANAQKATSSQSGLMTPAQVITLSAAVPNTRTVTAVYGLSGGGALAADINFAVDTFLIATRARLQKVADSLGGIKQGNITVTTTGSSGPATLISNILNIPQYSGGGSTDTTSLSNRIDALLAHYKTQTLTPGNNVNCNVTNGYGGLLLLNRATTTISLSNYITTGDQGWFRLTEDGTGARNIVLPANSIVPAGFGNPATPTIYLTTTGGAKDDLYWTYDGVNFHWTIVRNLLP